MVAPDSFSVISMQGGVSFVCWGGKTPFPQTKASLRKALRPLLVSPSVDKWDLSGWSKMLTKPKPNTR